MQGVPAAFFLALGPWRGGLAGLWGGQSLGYAVVDAGFAALLARIDWRALAATVRAHPGPFSALSIPTVNQLRVALFYGRAGRPAA